MISSRLTPHAPRPTGSLIILALLCGLLFFYRLGDRGFTSSHEARAAQDAQGIVAEGDWVLPQLFDRRVELQKPPLYYWLVALLTEIRGGPVDAWTVRVPAALTALAGVLALYLFCAACGRPVAGFVAAAILATCRHYTWLARVGRIDMPLTLTVLLAVTSFYLGCTQFRERPGRRAWPWFLLSYLALAAGLLLKGPIAVVLPVVVGLAFAAGEVILQRRPVTLSPCHLVTLSRRLGLWWGVPLVLLLAGPWYVLASLQTHGDFLRVFFWYHNVERGFGDGDLPSHPWWLYGPRLLADLFPWSLLLPAALWWSVRQRAWRRDPSARLGLAWLAAIFVLLSCLSFKRADYLLPAYPGAALFLGCTAERWWQTRRAGGVSPLLAARFPESAPSTGGLRPPLAWLTARRAAYGFALVLGGCVAGWWVYVDFLSPAEAAAEPTERFAAAVRARTALPVVFFRTEDHALAFHVGRPIETVLEWENLDAWLLQQSPLYVVMPPDCAREAGAHLTNGSLEEVLRTADRGPGHVGRPVVLLRGRVGRRDTPRAGS